MYRKSILPQKGKAIGNDLKLKTTVRKSLSIPENARKKRHYVEKKKKEVGDDVTISSGSWEEMAASSSSSSLTWMDYLPSDTYNSDSEESSTSASETSNASDNSPIEDTRSRATNFAEDFEDIAYTVDGYTNLDIDFKGPEKRTVMSLDASGITTSTRKEYPNMVKFLPKLTSTLLHGSKSRISLDTGGENSEITLTNHESSVKPSSSKGSEVDTFPELIPIDVSLSEISEPKEPAPPCMDDLTEELKIPDTFLAKKNAFEVKQQSKNDSHQVLGVSRHEKERFNSLDFRSTENTLLHETVHSIAADQASRRQKMQSSTKIHESRRNGKQKRIQEPKESSPPPGMEETITEVSSAKRRASSKKKHSSKSYEFQVLDDTQPISKYEKASFNILDPRPIESTLSNISVFSEASSQQRQIAEPKKIQKSQRDNNQKRSKSSNLPEELNLKEMNILQKQLFSSQDEALNNIQNSNNLRNKSSTQILSFLVDEEHESVHPSLKTRDVPSNESKENRKRDISRNLKKEKKNKLEKTVPMCPLFELFQMNPNTHLKDLPLKQKPFKHRNRAAKYANVDICPLEIAPVSGSGPRQIQLTSSRQNLRN